MAARIVLSGGFAGCCKEARTGCGLPSFAGSASSPPRPGLPPDIVRLIDALVRRLEREETLRAMNGGVLGATLVEAARAGGLRDVCFLLTAGADIEHVHEGRTALAWAAWRGHLAVVTVLLDVGAGRRDEALLWAAYSGRTPVVALLLDRGADIHYQWDSSLQIAAMSGHLEPVALLLDRGADVNTDNGLALRRARERGHEAVVALLLARGAQG